MSIEHAIIVVNKTRLEQLIERLNTVSQARFYIEHAGGNFDDYQNEHDQFKRSMDKVVNVISKETKLKIVDRQYLPNYLFSPKDVIVVIGQDGLVANTAKYTDNLPILAVNPDSSRNDGVLLPFNPENFRDGFIKVLQNQYKFKLVTMAEACLNDQQRLLAFNDFFIGPASHISARYKVSFNGNTENQSSSGIIVSTGAGATGWLSSVMTMANNIIGMLDRSYNKSLKIQTEWSDNKLYFVVREPFISKHSSATITMGVIQNDKKLIIESHIPVNGKIFSDGIENDFLQFNSGSIVEIGVAKEKAKIVTL